MQEVYKHIYSYLLRHCFHLLVMFHFVLLRLGGLHGHTPLFFRIDLRKKKNNSCTENP